MLQTARSGLGREYKRKARSIGVPPHRRCHQHQTCAKWRVSMAGGWRLVSGYERCLRVICTVPNLGLGVILDVLSDPSTWLVTGTRL